MDGFQPNSSEVMKKDRETYRKMQAIIHSAIDFAIIATDAQGKIIEWNPGAESIMQWSAAQMIGSSADRFFTPEDVAAGRIQYEMQTALAQGRASDERWHMREDGGRFWANGEMMPLYDDDGTHLGYLKILRDFTKQREAAEVQRLDWEFMRGVVTSSGDCIKVLDLESRLVYMNAGGQSVMEIEKFESVAGCPWPDFWEDEGNISAKAAVAAAKRGERGHFQNFANTHKGTRKFWDVQVSPIKDAAGQPERILVVSRDMTALKQAQQQLARNEEWLNLALGASDMVGLWDWDLQTEKVYADSRLARFYGVGSNDAEHGVSLAEFTKSIHPADLARVQQEIERHLAGSERYACEYRVWRADGALRWVDARGQIIRDAEGNPLRFPGAAWDITTHKEAENVIRDANLMLESRVAAALADREKIEERLRQSQKMEAVGQLTGGLAHDFNNLLAGISGSLELLERRVAQGRYSEVERYLEIAKGASKRAAALTHRLLAFSRRQTLDPKPTDANRLVIGLKELIERTVGPEITTMVETDSALWPILVDPHQLENALLNLCINARDAMPDGGQLMVETSNQHLGVDRAGEWQLEVGDYVSVCVTDTGIGMSAETIKRAVEPFFTTKPLGMGTGLGLSMVYGFARQSGGEVRIDSEVGMGTTVCVYLPRHHTPVIPDDEPAIAPPEMAVANHTVLVVDDEAALLVLTREVLEEAGYAVLEASDGISAMTVLRSDIHLDLLITDVGLPGGMNGRQIADAARMDRPGLPVLFVTGYAANGMSDPLPEGMSLLPKPFDIDALAIRAKELIESHRGGALAATR